MTHLPIIRKVRRLVISATLCLLVSTASVVHAKDIELIDSTYWKVAQKASESRGVELLDIKAAYPGHSWKHEIVRWGFMHDGLMMAVVLMTPRARAVHAAGVAKADGELFDSTTFNPEFYNNGVLFSAGQRYSAQSVHSGDFLEIIGVTCEVSKDSLIEPIVVVLDSALASGAKYDREKQISLRALFPVSLFDGSHDLKFHVEFRNHERKIVRFSKRTVRDLY